MEEGWEEVKGVKRIILTSGLTLTVDQDESVIANWVRDTIRIIINVTEVISKEIRREAIAYFDYERNHLNHLKPEEKFSLNRFTKEEQKTIQKAEEGCKVSQKMLILLGQSVAFTETDLRSLNSWHEVAVKIALRVLEIKVIKEEEKKESENAEN